LVSQLQFQLPFDVSRSCLPLQGSWFSVLVLGAGARYWCSVLVLGAGARCSYGTVEKITRLFWGVGLGEFTGV
jgi:hypothetical protein